MTQTPQISVFGMAREGDNIIITVGETELLLSPTDSLRIGVAMSTTAISIIEQRNGPAAALLAVEKVTAEQDNMFITTLLDEDA
jgi:hypothetical protein